MTVLQFIDKNIEWMALVIILIGIYLVSPIAEAIKAKKASDNQK